MSRRASWTPPSDPFRLENAASTPDGLRPRRHHRHPGEKDASAGATTTRRRHGLLSLRSRQEARHPRGFFVCGVRHHHLVGHGFTSLAGRPIVDTLHSPQKECTLFRAPKSPHSLRGLTLVIVSACSSASHRAGASSNAGASQAMGPRRGSRHHQSDDRTPSSPGHQQRNGVTSFHIKLTISGTINASALSSAQAAPHGDLKLDGTTVEGDVDVANEAAHLSLQRAGPADAGQRALTGDLILVNNASTKGFPARGKYSMVDLSSLGSTLARWPAVSRGVQRLQPRPASTSR